MCFADFHYAIGIIYSNFGKFGKALKCLDRALDLHFHPEWLFYRATFLRLHKKSSDFQVIEAYERFLLSTPPDGRFVSHAHYAIALSFFRLGKLKHAQMSWVKGQKAENIRLPCFKPVDEDDYSPKDEVQNLLRIGKSNGASNSRCNGKCKIIEIFCANCKKSNPTLHCSFCCNWVCGPNEYGVETDEQRECRKIHVEFHLSIALI